MVERLYGVPYSLSKMDMVAVPNQASAMENWGLIMYLYQWLLYDPAQPDPEQDSRFDVLETVAHELAHQWFGDLVTLAWWNEVWLNEAKLPIIKCKNGLCRLHCRDSIVN